MFGFKQSSYFSLSSSRNKKPKLEHAYDKILKLTADLNWQPNTSASILPFRDILGLG